MNPERSRNPTNFVATLETSFSCCCCVQTQTQPALFRPVQSFFESSAPAGLLATNRRMAYFVAVADFVPAAGALFEVRLSHGDEVEVLEDEPAPNGWIHVRSASGDQGLVPLSFLAKSTASTGRSNPPSGQSPTVDDSKIAVIRMARAAVTMQLALGLQLEAPRQQHPCQMPSKWKCQQSKKKRRKPWWKCLRKK